MTRIVQIGITSQATLKQMRPALTPVIFTLTKQLRAEPTTRLVPDEVSVAMWIDALIAQGDAAAPAPAAVVPALTPATPTITGTAEYGATLTAVAGTWGPAPVELGYQWSAGSTAIDGAVSETYAVPLGNIGQAITVTVTGTKLGYVSASSTSSPTATVAAAPLTGATPEIVGIAQVGEVLAASLGAWGPSAVTVTFQWVANGVVIPGATAAAYILTAALVGTTVTVTATGEALGYATTARTSAPTAAVLVAG